MMTESSPTLQYVRTLVGFDANRWTMCVVFGKGKDVYQGRGFGCSVTYNCVPEHATGRDGAKMRGIETRLRLASFAPSRIRSGGL